MSSSDPERELSDQAEDEDDEEATLLTLPVGGDRNVGTRSW
jgi:hypothetical protein